MAGPNPPSAAPDPIRLERWTVTSGSNVNSRAAVVLRAGSRDWQASAEGNGAVDALLRAVDAALADVLGGRPRAGRVRRARAGRGAGRGGAGDREGRATRGCGGGHAPAGGTRARCASTNIVAASVEAYVDALNAMLADPSWSGAAEAAGSRRGGAAEPGGVATAEFDDDARPIDTTEWFNR